MSNALNAGASGEMLRLRFQEGSGHLVHDAEARCPAAEVFYRFRSARHIPCREPSWRSCGIWGSALLFDGNSTWIEYPSDQILLEGEAWTLSAWIAPRAFPCCVPEDPEGDLKGRTAVVAQVNPEGSQGVLLGYEAFGRPVLAVGDGRCCRMLRGEAARLRAGRWNHLAGVWSRAEGLMRLYVDGVPAGEARMPEGEEPAPAAGHPLLIGKNEGGRRISAGWMDMFCGLMGEIRIEREAVPPEEIAKRAGIARPDIPWEDLALEDLFAEDPYRTQFHGQPRQHWMNEPHAPLYYRGMYHLFFQSNCIGSYWGNISWGHLVSRDTVRWRQVPDAIVPSENTVTPDGVWTGGATLDENGLPVLFFTAADLTYAAHGLRSNQNIGAAWPENPQDPELRTWRILDHLAVPQGPGMGRTGEFRDPHVWREPDGWYMVVCGGSEKTTGGAALLFHTERLRVLDSGSMDMDWKYLGPAFEMPDPKPVYGTSWELPVIMPVENRAGTKRRYFLFLMPAPPHLADNKVYYYVGDFHRERGRFVPDAAFGGEPRLLDYGDNIFTGPSVMKDPKTGRLLLFSIMQDKRKPREEAEVGWAHCVGLPRNLFLSDAGDDLCVEADPGLETLFRQELVDLEETDLREANRALERVRENQYCLRAEIRAEKPFLLTLQADEEGRGHTLRYDPEQGLISGWTSWPGSCGAKAPVQGRVVSRGGYLAMDLYMDRSLMEGFFNQDKALSIRGYSPAEARRIFFRAEGEMRIRRLQVWRMGSARED